LAANNVRNKRIEIAWSINMNYLSFPGLQAKIGGRSRSSIYRDIDLGRLPRPIKLGSRLYWNEADIDANLQARSKA
jgi:predicted DNA-binding transcriptional regulator AlpA